MSSGILLLPSVNRGCLRIVSQSLSGIIAYGSRFNIYFFDARCNPPLVLDSKFIFGAHSGRIISLSFCKNKDVELIASVGDDGEVKVWDIESRTCLAAAKGKECTLVAEWIYGSTNLLTFAPDTKSIVKWNIKTGSQVKIKTRSEILATAIVSNVKSPHLLAVGHGNGLITIMDIMQENVLHRFKGHSMEITSLSWSTISPDTILSASLDYSLRVWKMDEEKPVWIYYFPMIRMKPDDKKKLKIVGMCHPQKANVMICSSLRGDIGEVIFSENDKPKFYMYELPNWDMSCKYAFALCTSDDAMEDILYCFDPYKLSLWSMSKKRLVTQLHFLTGFVYDLTNSSVNPNLMAISNGDGILRIWTSQSETNKMDVVSIYVHYRTKIMTAAFHPTSENIIAYGTDEGRVGIMDIFKKKSVYSFETHHTGSVYSLSWGPCDKAPKTDSGTTLFYIYSCGGGVLYINRENGAKESAFNFDDIVQRPPDLTCIAKNVSEVCWKSDFSCVCIGSYTGVIDLFNEKLLFLSRINVQMKTVECLRWHPKTTYMSPDGSDLKFWLACGGNDTEIHVIDTSSVFDKDENSNASPEVVKKLLGHKKRVASICWSQHSDGFLVSASKDGSAIVWNVNTATIIATYPFHQDALNAVQWSVFDQDVIYSGGHDSCVRQWRISQQSISAPPEKLQGRKRMKKAKVSQKRKPNENGSLNDSPNGYVEEDNEEIKYENESPVSKDQSASEERKPTHTFSSEQKQGKFQNRKIVLFPEVPLHLQDSNNEELEACMKLADILNKKSSSTEIPKFDALETGEHSTNLDSSKFGLFTDQLAALKMIETQSEQHKESGDLSCVAHLSLMSGNIQDMLSVAAKSRTLSALHVAMAPSVSLLFWLEICESYAQQLLEEHQYLKSSSYFLMCGKTYEAINVLADKGNIVDALALAKARLPEADPLITKLLNIACKKFAQAKNNIAEAKCLMALNEPLRAAKALAQTSDPKFLRVAAHICKKFNLDQEAVEYCFLCLEKGLMQCDWVSVKMLSNQESHMKVYGSLIAVHEAFYHHIRHFKKQEGISVQEMFSGAEKVVIWKGNTCIDTKQSFIEFLYQLLQSQFTLHPDTSVHKVLEAIEIFSGKRSFGTSSDAHLTIAICITKFILLSILGDHQAAECSYLNIFASSHNVVFLPKIVCSLLFPRSLAWNISDDSITCSEISTAELEQNNVTSLFESTCNKLCKTISCYEKKTIKSLITSQVLLQCNLRSLADTVCISLSTKKLENHWLAFFLSSLVNDIARLAEKKDLKMQCKANQPKAVKSNLAQGSEVKTTTAVESTHNMEDKTNDQIKDATPSEVCDDSIDKQLQELIDLALKEADEKAKLFLKEKLENVSENTSTLADDGITQFEEREHSPNTVLIDIVTRESQHDPSESDSFTSAVSNNSIDKIMDDKQPIESEIPISIPEVADTVIVESAATTSDMDLDVDPCDDHSECLKNIDPFFNVVSFVAQTVCKDHFALLYYLKERLRVLNQNRASEGLSKALKDMKVEKQVESNRKSNKGRKMLLFSDIAEIGIELEKIDISVTDNHTENDELVDESKDSLATDTAICDIDRNCAKDSHSVKEPVQEEAIETEISDIAILDEDKKCIADMSSNGETVCEDGAGDSFSMVPERAAVKTETFGNAVPDQVISEDHNYAKQENGGETSEKDLPLMNEMSELSDQMAASLTLQNVANHIPQSELGELSELICLLETKLKEYPYPNPFDAVSKILQATTTVIKKSPCSESQEKLHGLIHEVLSWCETFFVGEINFICQIC